MGFKTSKSEYVSTGTISVPGPVATMIRNKGITHFDLYLTDEGLLYKPVDPDHLYDYNQPDPPQAQVPDWLSASG